MGTMIKFIQFILALTIISGLLTASAWAENYPAVKGLKSAKTIFDFRTGEAKNALILLKLTLDTYQDRVWNSLKDKPDFAVVFMGNSVNLLSNGSEVYSAADRKLIKKIKALIPTMDEAGIRLEVCLFAAKSFGLDPKTFPPQITRVPNGWVSAIAYQQHGYALIAAY